MHALNRIKIEVEYLSLKGIMHKKNMLLKEIMGMGILDEFFPSGEEV